MFKYYISEIKLDNINTKKLNNAMDSDKSNSRILLSKNGKYLINNDNFSFFIINDVDNKDLIIKNYLEKYTLFISELNWKQVKNLNICRDHVDILVDLHTYTMNNKKTKLVIEYFNNKILDLYILSELEYDNISLKEDISYLLSKII